MAPGSHIKGGDIAESLQRAITDNQLSVKILYMTSYPQTLEGSTSFWKDIDYLLVLSRAENSPNVIHEAKNLGIPIIATKVGGITELLDSEFDISIELENLNTETILKIIERLNTRNQVELQQKRMQINFHHYVDRSVVDHISLYNEVMKRI